MKFYFISCTLQKLYLQKNLGKDQKFYKGLLNVFKLALNYVFPYTSSFGKT
jgi:hypothetical protein